MCTHAVCCVRTYISSSSFLFLPQSNKIGVYAHTPQQLCHHPHALLLLSTGHCRRSRYPSLPLSVNELSIRISLSLSLSTYEDSIRKNGGGGGQNQDGRRGEDAPEEENTRRSSFLCSSLFHRLSMPLKRDDEEKKDANLSAPVDRKMSAEMRGG